MNKVFNINLGGYPFTIDDEAYEQLADYLKTIHRHFSGSEGYEEITSDIENRMAELFQEKLGKQTIVTERMVNEAIVIMGTSADFGADTEENTATAEEPSYQTGKRLFRNTEEEVIGGVCSGLSAYFGIQDPIWIRLAFVVFTFSAGIGVLPYIILWIIIPAATSSSDRLAMRGEPINVSNIAKTVQHEIEHISDKISGLKKKSKRNVPK